MRFYNIWIDLLVRGIYCQHNFLVELNWPILFWSESFRSWDGRSDMTQLENRNQDRPTWATKYGKIAEFAHTQTCRWLPRHDLDTINVLNTAITTSGASRVVFGWWKQDKLSQWSRITQSCSRKWPSLSNILTTEHRQCSKTSDSAGAIRRTWETRHVWTFHAFTLANNRNAIAQQRKRIMSLHNQVTVAQQQRANVPEPEDEQTEPTTKEENLAN